MGLSFWTDTSSSSPYQENDIKTFFLDNDQPRWHIEWLSVGMAFGLVFVMSRVYNFIQAMRIVSNLPGMRVPMEAHDIPGAAFPTCWWNPGLDFPWRDRFSLYKRYSSETISLVPWLFGNPTLYTSNLEVARQVVAGGVKSIWIKPETASAALLIWGMNLVASEKDTWRRHRRIMGPAFNNKTYALVWARTVDNYKAMIAHEEGWSDPSTKQIDVTKVQKLTFKLALLVIAQCGFGIESFTWSEPPATKGGEMGVQESLRTVTDESMFLVSAPKWVLKLPIGWVRKIKTAQDTVTAFMRTQVADRKAEVRSGATQRDDVFSMLVQANEDDVKFPLDDGELIGNVFVLLFAGHETTAHTLAATLGFLSIYQEIQEEILVNILKVVGPTRDPTFEDYDALDKVLSAFHEALRMFPSGSLLIRQPTEDTLLTLPNPVGEEGNKKWPIPKGLRVVVDMIGIQYNPRYFPEPEKYKPSRWYGGKTSDEAENFTAFSIGPRQCIGRKFATTEAVAFLTLLLRDWKVEPLLNDGETKESWKERVLQGKMLLTLGVGPVPVRFLRRHTKA